ncbi:MAG: ACP S-malonyltransferase [Deltaproteobacteria bacterium]|nr:ACP S-malonyltransferase [Deltaproteobacteria bacterium]
MTGLAYLFPGQGSQYVGMGRALCEAMPEARATFGEASEVLGLDLAALCYEGPEEFLALTANVQPAILTVSVAVARTLEARGARRPVLVAGHSLGEYSALVCAGALAFRDAVRLVRRRGEFMQETIPAGEGAMAAILGLEPSEVEALCHEVAKGEVVSCANYNSPGQVVVSGHREAVGRAVAAARARGARRAVPLPVSAPFHCALMAPAAARLQAELDRVEIHQPAVPVVTNVEAEPTQDPARIRDLLVSQVVCPVRWDASLRRMAAAGVTLFAEVGPGKVLAGLVRRTLDGIPCVNVEDPSGLAALGA